MSIDHTRLYKTLSNNWVLPQLTTTVSCKMGPALKRVEKLVVTFLVDNSIEWYFLGEPTCIQKLTIAVIKVLEITSGFHT